MNYKIVITKLKTIDEIENSWNKSHYIDLLEAFDFYDDQITDENELKELLFLAINDVEPDEAAAQILSYKLSEKLTENQINAISHEMLEDVISEEYPDISLHSELFKINQLLNKAYNGKFPNAKATLIELEIKHLKKPETKITKEIIVKALQGGLAKNNLIQRLFTDELQGKTKFIEAKNIIWEFTEIGKNTFRIITSDYWMSKADFESLDFEANVMAFEEDNLQE